MKKRLFPVIAGIFIGIIVGVGTAVPTVRLSEWLAHGLYNTALKSVVHSVNHQVWIACIACCVIWAALAVRARLNGWIRRIPELIGVTSLLVALNIDVVDIVARAGRRPFDILRKLGDDVRPDVIKDAFANGGPQIIASIVILMAGLFILARVRRKPGKSLTEIKVGGTSGKSEYAAKFLSPVNRFAGIAAQGNWVFYAIVLVVFIGLNLASLSFDISNSRALRDRPNIILIQIDTLRADHLGCYGYERKTSPNIDKLASESVRFEKAIAPAPWTTSSVAQFMTGRYLKSVSFECQFSGKPVNAVSISEALKDRGYSTVGVNSNLLAGSGRGFAQGFDSYDESVYDELSSPYVVSTAVDKLNALKDKKFFMFLLFMDVHSPYTLHEEHNFYPDYKGKLGKRIQVRATDRTDQMSKDDLKYMRAVYDSEIAYTDGYIGKLMDELKKMNLYNDTLIVLLSDHGEEFGEHGRLEHALDLYDETLSVPVIIKLPGQKRGSTVGGVFPLLDLFPTIMNAVHFNTSSFHLDGTARRMQGLRKIDDQVIYSSTDFADADQSCIRTNTHKLIADKLSSKQELYSLESDPAEKQNVLKSQPSLADVLSKRLKGMDQEIDKTAPSGILSHSTGPRVDNSAKLKSLGYLQ